MLSKEKLHNESGAHVDEVKGNISLDKTYKGIFPIVNFNVIEVGANAKVGNDMFANSKITCGSGCFVNGNMYSLKSIEIYSGTQENPTVILGDITSEGKITISGDKGGAIIVVGNIIGEAVEIKCGYMIVRGDIYGISKLNISPKDMLLVGGKVRAGISKDERGKAALKNVTMYGSLIYGDVLIDENVTILEPNLVVKYGIIKIPSRLKNKFKVRVFTDTCLKCTIVKHPAFCEKYKSKVCDIYDYVDNNDLFEMKTGARILSWNWRAGFRQLAHNLLIHHLYEQSLKRPTKILFQQEVVDGINKDELFETSANRLERSEIRHSDILQKFENLINSSETLKNDKAVNKVLDLFRAMMNIEKDEEASITLNPKFVETIPLAHIDQISELSLAETSEISVINMICENCGTEMLFKKGEKQLCPNCGSDQFSIAKGKTGDFDLIYPVYKKHFDRKNKGKLNEFKKFLPDVELTSIASYLVSRGHILTKDQEIFMKPSYLRRKIYDTITKRPGIYSQNEFETRYNVPESAIKEIFIDLSYESGVFVFQGLELLLYFTEDTIMETLNIFQKQKKVNYEDFMALLKRRAKLSKRRREELGNFLVDHIQGKNIVVTYEGIYEKSHLFSRIISWLLDEASKGNDHLLKDVLENFEIPITQDNINMVREIIAELETDQGIPCYIIYSKEHEIAKSMIMRVEKFLKLVKNQTKIKIDKIASQINLELEDLPRFFDMCLEKGVVKGAYDEEYFENVVEYDFGKLEKSISQYMQKLDELAATNLAINKRQLSADNLVDEFKIEAKSKRIHSTTATINYYTENDASGILKEVLKEVPVVFNSKQEFDGYNIETTVWGGNFDNKAILTEYSDIKTDTFMIAKLTIDTVDRTVADKLLEKVIEKFIQMDQQASVTFPDFYFACVNCGNSLSDATPSKDQFVLCSVCRCPTYIASWKENP